MIYTVRGPIHKNELGMTLSHEHIKWDCDSDYAIQLYFDKENDQEDTESSFQKILPEVEKLYKSGCRSIVEATPPMGGQNLQLLNKLSQATNMHIIPSTGFNMPKQIHTMFGNSIVDALSQRWTEDFEKGLDEIKGLSIKPGYIKLLLDRGELSKNDKDMLKAAVMTSKKTDLPIHCHILESKMVYEVIELLKSEGADFERFLWAHADMESDVETITFAFETGMWIGLDMIKQGTYQDKFVLLDKLIKLGYADKLLLSQDYDLYEEAVNQTDVCSSFFLEFIPHCVNKGIKETLLTKILNDNPGTFYDVKEMK